MAPSGQTQEPIAIIGAGCRFSGRASRPSKLWELLKSPVNAASKIPTERFNVNAFYHPDGPHHGTTNVTESYFISEGDIRHFDAQFFNTPPTEADPMDPQHRQLLEVVYEALEDSGLTVEGMQGSDTAVYVGLMCNDYSAISGRDFDYIPTYGATGIAASNASSRVSYFFDWHGACMTIDTACSSSLIALHQAVQTLRSGASTVAVAAGTNLLLDPLPYVSESNLNMLSPTGRSRMWDADADGYARGDGVAAVVLKRLSQALRDGDQVDCIIRETGANQDGRTKGITMPSGVAQTAMIRDTYARAGLDPTNPLERCQYFEAHGTGTPAGDPQEASALDATFFKPSDEQRDPNDILFVGSAKTVVGHTEGTAGLAGILKAYLALKHKIIPPNLLFNQLSPKVEPFYRNLRILTEAQPWPSLPEGVPRRASVNSFGFGGSNAHAILESYHARQPILKAEIPEDVTGGLAIIPFIFSASSDSSLSAALRAYVSFLERNPGTNLADLKYTLSTKRSTLARRAAFSTSTVDQLVSKIKARLEDASASSGVSRSASNPTILGVFTGQGAQWPTMGAGLVAAYPLARQVVDELDRSLATLPEADRPAWTILEQLSADAQSSRIAEAAISQPLCTAVQLVLARVLEAAGVTFKAVVGHSSGEIAAAHIAGFLSASDAIRIAYYRGLHAKLAAGAEGKKGGMMAVGTSYADAMEFCELEDFEGRISVAACNSSSSITISGDIEAIEEAKTAFDQEKKFARVLKVDTAYHSYHMDACSGAYAESLKACVIRVLEPAEGQAPAWLSSVNEGTRMHASDALKASYWVDNMTNPVLFSQAIEAALDAVESLDLSLEVGPHPALKGPATQTIQEKTGKDIPYTGTLARGQDDVEAVANSLGTVWSWLGSAAVDWNKLQHTFCGSLETVMMLRDLPLYQWDHNRSYWIESRYGKLFRTQDSRVHRLLGVRIPDGTSEEMRWKNILKPREIPWLSGHALQGQIVFPGTGYIALAMEAAMEVAGPGKSVQFIELCDLEIIKAIAIDESPGTEVVVSMTGITGLDSDDLIEARFTSFSIASKDSTELVVNAQGRVRINLGEAANDVLMPRETHRVEMADVDIDDFYGAMGALGYGYAGPFKGLATLKRKLGRASGNITRPPHDDELQPLLFHPGMLDTSLQTLFAAFSAPGDARLWSLHVPTGIRRVTLVPSLCGKYMPEEVDFDSRITAVRPNHITGDVDLFSADGVHKCIEIDGLGFVPFTAATEKDDRVLFSKVTWGLGEPNGELASGGRRATPWQIQKALDCNRAAFFYLRTLNAAITQAEKDAGLADHHRALLEFAAHCEHLVRTGKNPIAKEEWLSDTLEQTREMIASYGYDGDFNIMKAVGENIIGVVRNEITILEVMTKDGYLDDYYETSLGAIPANHDIAEMVGQIAYRYPHCNILEIGAGTGGATRGILDNLKTAFTSYTYTDISTGFFEKAREMFRPYAGRMIFNTLDITKDPVPQGYAANSYDIVVASNVLHATAPLVETLKNVRKLLKPGGYLVLLEIVQDNALGVCMSVGLTMGGLPGWWVGVGDGRKHAPTIPLTKWNSLLKKSGFAGIETHTPMLDPETFVTGIFAAKAVNEDLNLLRRPLWSRPDQIPIKDLLLIGGESIETSQTMDELEDLLEGRCENLIRVSTLEELEGVEVPRLATVLCLADLDSPVFKDITETRWEMLKRVCTESGAFLWVTSGSTCDQPYAGAMLGLHRSIPVELMQLRLQLLEIPSLDSSSASIFVDLLLKLQLSLLWMLSPTPKDYLWTAEPELKLENSHLKINRLMPNTDANDRYNSAKRVITKNVDPQVASARLEWIDTTSEYSVHESQISIAPSDDDLAVVAVSHSLLLAIRTAAGLLFLGIGADTETGSKVIVLTTQNASIVAVPRDCTAPVNLAGGLDEPQVLTAAAAYLCSQQIMARMQRLGSSLLIHEPDAILASTLASQLKQDVNSHVSLTTSDPHKKTGSDSWIHVHPRVPRNALQRCLPAQVDLFVDLSSTAEESGLGARIAGALAKPCEQMYKSGLISKESNPLLRSGRQEVADILKRINVFVADIATGTLTTPITTNTRSVADVVLESNKSEESIFSVVEWQRELTVATVVEPVDWRKAIFQDGKTYWMVGLAGDLGQSISDWMIDHGARNIVLTSRNPQVPIAWVEACTAKGARIEFIAGDVTNMKSLRQVYDKIGETFPPIAGVANGALVLRDKLFVNTSFEDLETVFRPKVTGTLNLHELFSEDTLDWFIAFSSIVATSGNSGQSAYSAANCFMKAFINQRRKRGLVGSIMDISRVHGVGYVERETKATGSLTEKDISKIYRVSMPMSEADLHQLFAEAVLASKLGSGRDPELITGIRTLLTTETSDIFWAANLKFSHFVHEAESADTDVGGKAVRVAVKIQLQEAKSVDDVVGIIKAAFIAKLTASLEHSDDQSISDDTPLIDLGMDSLVAVEVRSWFMKELGVDMPVLKILGGAAAADLILDTVEKLPEEFMSKFDGATVTLAAPATNDGSSVHSSSAASLATPESEQHTNSSPPSEPGSEQEPAKVDISFKDRPKEAQNSPGAAVFQIMPRSSFKPDIVRTEPMSYGQARFWFLRQYSEDSTTSNITFFFRMSGAFDPNRLRDTLTMICQRHEALHTCFFSKDDAAYQGIMKKSAIEMEHTVVPGEDDVRAIYERLQNYTYDIEQGDTMRAILCKTFATSTFYLVVGYHHIVMDGYSWEVLFGELQRGYMAGSLAPVRRQYSMWAAEQRRAIGSRDMLTERKFWQKELAPLPPTLPLLPMALVSSRRPLKTYLLSRCSLKLDPKLNKLVKEQSRLNKASIFHFYLATFKVLLSRFTGADDLCIGMAEANRMDSADAGIIGLLLNLLPLRFRSTSKQTFANLLKDARAKAYAALAHSKVPFNVILDDVDVPRTSSHNPLFQAFIEYRQANKVQTSSFENDQPRDSTSYSKTAYDITLNVLEDHAGETTISFGAQCSLYSPEGAITLLHSYVAMLEFFVGNATAFVDNAPLFAKEDISRALDYATSPSPVQQLWPKTLLHRLYDMVEMHKDAVAIKDTLGNALTYLGLARRVTCIAAALVKAGVVSGSYVGAFIAPSVDSTCSALAIMSLGAVYIPFDYRQGADRLSKIAEACKPSVILVDSSSSQTASTWGFPICNVDAINDATTAPDKSVQQNRAEPEQAAVILFTSGTTGVPKGIMLKHSSLVNAVEGVTKQFGLSREVVLQQTALSFDMSLDEMFVALCNGGTLVVVGKSLRGDSHAIMKLIASECITYTRATPPEYLSWIRHGAGCVAENTSWKWAFAGGDRMAHVLRQQFRGLSLPQLRLFNSYGPTEITLSATKIEVPYHQDSNFSPDESIPIGFPMPGYAIYVVDEHIRLVAPGIQGEIIVAGAGVSLGYLGDTNLTRERFLDNPWAPSEFVRNGWTKMYRTGDRGYFTQQGEVVFKSRMAGDSQIKLRGIRMELGDIESNILDASKGSLTHVVCTVRGDDSNAFLVGYVVFSSPDFSSQQDRNASLSQLLALTPVPQYMKPAALIALEHMPLNVHQKIDRASIASLPIPAIGGNEGHEQEVQLNELENSLSELWKLLLPTEMGNVVLTPTTGFFSVGGNSLRLVELLALIRTTFNVSIPLMDLLEANTLGEMATNIQVAVLAGQIDWELETSLSPVAQEDINDHAKPQRRTNNLEVILTGATGHLGQRLLSQLTAHPNISKVHCIAVRDPSKLKNTTSSGKRVVYPGDLTQPQLGLSDTTFASLSATVDSIIHCAAARAFWEPYGVLRAPNVTPTRELVRLATLRRAPIHFMSSGGVLPLDKMTATAGSVRALLPAATGADGYLASKWAAEQILEGAAARQPELGVTIYRTLPVEAGSPAARDGAALPAAVVESFARAALVSNTILDAQSGVWSGSFDVVAVADVAARIVAAVVDGQDETVRFTHIPAVARVGSPTQLESLFAKPEVAERMSEFERLPGPQWLGALKRAGFEWMVASQDATLDGSLRSRR